MKVDRIKKDVLVAVIAFANSSSGYFLSWGSSDQTSSAPTTYYYHRRLVQGPQYAIAENGQPQQMPSGPMPIPSVPIQVPLSAQLSAIPNVQNVQLVPCLCPLSEYPYDNRPVPQENVYLPIQHVQQQPVQQQLQQTQQVQQQQQKN
ncbi:hypothetical protein NQ318_019454 [Aromia moschata]|uniref:Uncharacterized protein n=1 Tax=Aromia moschata TaxID=1265417 RepID=A0AAV8XBF6_9CUCU|nr:hypothetical protein NQ318_019454 [Aromia moschata]